MFESLLSYGPITEHWFLSILAIIICSFVPKTQRVARGTGLAAIGIFLIWLLMLICHPSGHYEGWSAVRKAIGYHWVEISLTIGIILATTPKVGTTIRGIVAFPVCFMALIIYTFILQLGDTYIISPLLSMIPIVGPIYSIVGNVGAITTFFFIMHLVAGRASKYVFPAATLLLIIFEIASIQNFGECNITLLALSHDRVIDWWDWLSFAISLVAFAYANRIPYISTPREENGSSDFVESILNT